MGGRDRCLTASRFEFRLAPNSAGAARSEGMSSIKIWAKVPGGSTLAVSVVETAGACIAAARLREDDGTEEEWVHSQLVPGPQTKTVSSPRDYVVTLRVEFTATGTSTASIRAQVTKPNGDVYGSTYSYDVSGAKGDEKRATILVQTANL
jgi:hypothetical protein